MPERNTIRVHLLMFGSYSIGEQTKPDKSLRLALLFSKGTIYLYTCCVKLVDGNLDTLYDWEADVMSETWNHARARKKIKLMPETMVCDALLDQQIFSGVGNIIKNEVLFRIKLHPETLVGDVPPAKLRALIKEARNYSFDFLKWKKEFVLKNTGWRILKKYCGKTKRRTFYCANCQVKFT